MSNYSILIPIHNEIRYIHYLLDSLNHNISDCHEVIIIDDGSDDGSENILNDYENFILIKLSKNMGKGYAIRKGLSKASNNKIVIFDGDMEINPSEINKLMLLNKKKNIKFVMGNRFKNLKPIKSNFDWGNFIFTSFFNILFLENHKDILCCAKAFYKDDLKELKLNSTGFDIDIELSSILTKINRKNPIPQVHINYKRRSISDGKKLKTSDGWVILKRIIDMVKYF